METSLMSAGSDRCFSNDALDCPRNADAEIMPRGQRLRLGDDAALFRPEDCIGIGTAGIDAEEDSLFSCRLSHDVLHYLRQG